MGTERTTVCGDEDDGTSAESSFVASDDGSDTAAAPDRRFVGGISHVKDALADLGRAHYAAATVATSSASASKRGKLTDTGACGYNRPCAP